MTVQGVASPQYQVILSTNSTSKINGVTTKTPYKVNGIVINVTADQLRLDGETKAAAGSGSVDTPASFTIHATNDVAASEQKFASATQFTYQKAGHPKKNTEYEIAVTPAEVNKASIDTIAQQKNGGSLEPLTAKIDGKTKTVTVNFGNTDESIHLVVTMRNTLKISGITRGESNGEGAISDPIDKKGIFTVKEGSATIRTFGTQVNPVNQFILTSDDSLIKTGTKYTIDFVPTPKQVKVSVKDYIDVETNVSIGNPAVITLTAEKPVVGIAALLEKSTSTVSVTVPPVDDTTKTPIKILDAATRTGLTSGISGVAGIANPLLGFIGAITGGQNKIQLYTRYNQNDFDALLDTTQLGKTNVTNKEIPSRQSGPATLEIKGVNKFTDKLCLVKIHDERVPFGVRDYVAYRGLTLKQGGGGLKREIKLTTDLSKTVQFTAGTRNDYILTRDELLHRTSLESVNLTKDDISDSVTYIEKKKTTTVDTALVNECLNKANGS